MKPICLIFLWLALSCACSRSTEPVDLAVARDLAVLDTLGWLDGQEGFLMLMEEPQLSFSLVQHSKDEESAIEVLGMRFPSASPDLLERVISQDGINVGKQVPSTSPQLQLFPSERIKEIPEGSQFSTIQREFPGCAGLIWTTPVVFSEEQNQAIVKFSWYCGPTCGSAHIVLLERTGEVWSVVQSECTAVL